MVTFDEFTGAVRHALTQLYNPAFEPEPALRARADDSTSALRQAIESLKPGADVPAHAQARRIYEALSWRYLQQLTQEETAERMHITARQLRRVQQTAVDVLARRLWAQWQGGDSLPPSTAAPSPAGDMAPQGGSGDLSLQVRQEVTALQRHSPPENTGTAPIGPAMAAVAALVHPLAERRRTSLTVHPTDDSLMVAIDPVALRQVLVEGVSALLSRVEGGDVALAASGDGDRVKITLSSRGASGAQGALDFGSELLTAYGGTALGQTEPGGTVLVLDLPRVQPVVVLVVDDNAELVHVYGRYVHNSRYRIVATSDAEGLFSLIEQVSPDIIVLDVMLPNTDGWEVLARLRESPATRTLPIIVCSVVRAQDLSLALGATRYEPKPVGRQRFLEALDSCL